MRLAVHSRHLQTFLAYGNHHVPGRMLLMSCSRGQATNQDPVTETTGLQP